MKIDTWKPILPHRESVEQSISRFWDKTSPAWFTVWGPHLHHGFYDREGITPLEAQEALIEKLLLMIDIPRERKTRSVPANAGIYSILDVGCGMGSTSIYLAKQYDAEVTGITISAKQIKIASLQAEKHNIRSVSFKLENALSMQSLKDKSFDIVWSLESCEQFYDKNLFLQQAYRVLKPGGTLLLATWCADSDDYEGEDAKRYQYLCRAFDLPYMPTIRYYRQLLIENKFNIMACHDWTKSVAKSWDIGISLINAYPLFQLFKMTGFRGLRFIKQVKAMRDAFQRENIRYGVFYAKKLTKESVIN